MADTPAQQPGEPDFQDDWANWSDAVRHAMYLFQTGLAARYSNEMKALQRQKAAAERESKAVRGLGNLSNELWVCAEGEIRELKAALTASRAETAKLRETLQRIWSAKDEAEQAEEQWATQRQANADAPDWARWYNGKAEGLRQAYELMSAALSQETGE